MKTEQYIRKPFEVDAVQVTEENIEEVAKWCMGDIRHKTGPGRGVLNYIKVRVHRPLNARQTEAYVGDWVLYANKGYKVYTEKAFNDSFMLPIHKAPEQSTLPMES